MPSYFVKSGKFEYTDIVDIVDMEIHDIYVEYNTSIKLDYGIIMHNFEGMIVYGNGYIEKDNIRYETKSDFQKLCKEIMTEKIKKLLDAL